MIWHSNRFINKLFNEIKKGDSIIQFTDLHFGEGENETWGKEQDINSTRVMNTILDKEGNVDLILFTGDLITGNNIDGNVSKYWEYAVNVAKTRNIPWAITFGNHDDLSTNDNSTRFDLMSLDIKLGSHSKFGPIGIPGVSNYNLNIYEFINDNQKNKNNNHNNKEEKENSGRPLATLWLFDSGDGENDCTQYDKSRREFGGDGYKCNTYITKEQIEWYENETLKYAIGDDHLPLWEGAFFHIPLQEYMLIWNYDVCFGWNNDSIACQPVNEGLFKKFVEIGRVRMISVGHNHGNDFCSTFDNIKMCYGRHSGYGGYGTWERGARVIQLTHNPNKNTVSSITYITFETGQQLFNQPHHFPNSTQIPQTKCTN
ncbi:hypothetical protein RB653_004666 [Dictyostelium firmibasis]|uniref:Calcineurin-like phosphoesterase domain-containing protein n=1 Tax=Dictyostelium firmibasis TaxID=79012 RepID=A0AAN7U7X1_9MYCE